MQFCLAFGHREPEQVVSGMTSSSTHYSCLPSSWTMSRRRLCGFIEELTVVAGVVGVRCFAVHPVSRVVLGSKGCNL